MTNPPERLTAEEIDELEQLVGKPPEGWPPSTIMKLIAMARASLRPLPGGERGVPTVVSDLSETGASRAPPAPSNVSLRAADWLDNMAAALADVAGNNDVDLSERCDPDEGLCSRLCEQSGCYHLKIASAREVAKQLFPGMILMDIPELGALPVSGSSLSAPDAGTTMSTPPTFMDKE